MATGTIQSTVPPPVAESLEHDRVIHRQLSRTSLHVRLVDLASSAAFWVVGVVAFFIFAALFDHLIGLGTSGRVLGLLVLAGGSAYYFYAVIWPLLARGINPTYAARTIEEATPSLKNSLINFLLLRQDRGSVKEIVFQAVERKAASDIAAVPVEATVDRSSLIRAGYVLCGAMALLAAYKILSPKDPFQTVARVLAPWAEIARPSRVQITDVQPGSAEVYHGTTATVSAIVSGVREGDPVKLLFSTADGQTVDFPVEMTLAPGGLRYQCVLPTSAATQSRHAVGDAAPFSGLPAGLQQDLSYRIIAGDAETPNYRLTVIAAPTIVVERLEYLYPAYIKKVGEKIEQQGDIKGLEGTRVTIHAVANQPIKSAWIEFDPAATGAPQLLELASEGTRAWGTIVLQMQRDRQTPWHTSYQVRFRNAHTQRSEQPILNKIEVIRDLPPEVQLLQPQKLRVEVPDDGELTIEVRALDPDFGLSSVRLEGTVAAKPPLKIELLPTGSRDLPQITVPHVFRPRDHKLAVGDEVKYVAIAEDNRMHSLTGQPEPNVARTKEYTLVVVAAQPKNQPKNQDPKNQDPKNQDPKNQNPMGGQQQNPMGGQQQNPMGGQQQNPMGGQQQNPMGGQQQNPMGGQQQNPMGGQQKNPMGGQQQNPMGGQQQNPMGGQQQNPMGGQQQNPMGGQQQNPMGGQQQNPMGGQQQNPMGGQQQNPMGGQQQGGSPMGGGAGGQQGGEPQQANPMNGGAPGERTNQGNPGGQAAGNDSQSAGQQGDPQTTADGQTTGQGGKQQGKAHDGKAIEEALKDLQKRGQQPQPNSGGQQNPMGGQGDQNAGQPMPNPNQQYPNQQNPNGQGQAGQRPMTGQQAGQPQNAGESGQQGNNTPSTGAPAANQAERNAAGQEQPGQGQRDPMQKGKASDRVPDEQKGQNPSQQPGDGGKGGTPKGPDQTQQQPKSKAGSEGEPKDPGAGQNGDQGAGAASKDKTGSGEGQEANRDRSKDQQPMNSTPQESDPSAASGSKHQSDSKGGQSGDQSGGGGKGAGQGAGQQGNDSAGGHSPGDQGAGKAQETGNGETGSKAGKQQEAAGKTGQAGTKQGQGSTTKSGDQGDAVDSAAGQEGQSGKGQAGSKQQAGKNEGGSSGGKGGGGAATDASGDSQAAPSDPREQELKAADEANLEYTRKATELALKHLKEEEHNPDPELLNKLGWTKDDLAEFLRRWDAMQKSAQADPNGKRELDEALRSLGLRDPANRKRSAGGVTGDTQRGLRDGGNRSAPPAAYRDLFDAFRKGAARSTP